MLHNKASNKIYYIYSRLLLSMSSLQCTSQIINNSLGLDNDIMTVTVFGYLILISIFYFSVFSLVLVWIEKINQPHKTVFHHISKQLEFRKKCSVTCRVLFLTLFALFGIKVKHGLSCLIHYNISAYAWLISFQYRKTLFRILDAVEADKNALSLSVYWYVV